MLNTSVYQENSSSFQDTEMQVLKQPSTSQVQFVPPMDMPYIEGPKMDLTVNDGLCNRFSKWKPKSENIPPGEIPFSACRVFQKNIQFNILNENILDCELAMLPDSKKCKKVVAWSGDFGTDQYVSWCLPVDKLNLDTMWSKYEEFCKPQTNEVGARFDLLTTF